MRGGGVAKRGHTLDGRGGFGNGGDVGIGIAAARAIAAERPSVARAHVAEGEFRQFSFNRRVPNGEPGHGVKGAKAHVAHPPTKTPPAHLDNRADMHCNTQTRFPF